MENVRTCKRWNYKTDRAVLVQSRHHTQLCLCVSCYLLISKRLFSLCCSAGDTGGVQVWVWRDNVRPDVYLWDSAKVSDIITSNIWPEWFPNKKSPSSSRESNTMRYVAHRFLCVYLQQSANLAPEPFLLHFLLPAGEDQRPRHTSERPDSVIQTGKDKLNAPNHKLW